MSDVHHTRHDGPHEGPIKTPKQLIVAVLFAFVVPIVVIVLLVSFVGADPRPAAGSNGFSADAVAQRIQPVGWVEVKDASDPSTLKTGEQVFKAQCVACHGAGVAGAPRLGDTAAWAPRVAKGYEVLLTSALKGKGAMAPQGGGDHTDFEIGRAVVYLANASGGKLAEPTLADAPGDAAASSTPASTPPTDAMTPMAVPAIPAPVPPAMWPAWPVRRSSATRPRGRRGWRWASMR